MAISNDLKATLRNMIMRKDEVEELIATLDASGGGSGGASPVHVITGDYTLNPLTDQRVLINNTSPMTFTLPVGVNGMTFNIGFSYASSAVTLASPDSIDGVVATAFEGANNPVSISFIDGTWYAI